MRVAAPPVAGRRVADAVRRVVAGAVDVGAAVGATDPLPDVVGAVVVAEVAVQAASATAATTVTAAAAAPRAVRIVSTLEG